MRSSLGLIASLIVVLLTTSTRTVAQVSRNDRFRVFERYLETLQRRAAIPGLSAAIMENGQIVWEYAVGFQNVAGKIPARPDTPYRIASLTKTFTSTLLLQCVENGTLSLDTPISRYTNMIPEPDATVRHVLSHTSFTQPGRSFQYDGDRFVALTPVVEECTGLPFRQALSRGILDRLGMTDSVPGQDLERPSEALRSLFDDVTLFRYQQVIARLATPYTTDRRGRSILADYPPRTINASAGLISTVRDLARFDAALDGNLLVNAATQDLAWTQFISSSNGPQPYGLGWFVQRYRQQRVVWHYGSWPQFSSLHLKLPAQRRTLLLLANSGGLSTPFALSLGDISRSSFAQTFLTLFLQ